MLKAAVLGQWLVLSASLGLVGGMPCQVRANADCLCEPFSVRHPNWGIEKVASITAGVRADRMTTSQACCMSPAQFAGNSTASERKWCYCQDGGKEECSKSSHPTEKSGGLWSFGESGTGSLAWYYDGDAVAALLPTGDFWTESTAQ